MRQGSCCVDRDSSLHPAALASRVLGSAMERCFLPLPRHPSSASAPILLLTDFTSEASSPEGSHSNVAMPVGSCYLGLRPPSPLTPASQMHCPLDSPKGSQAQLFLYPNPCLSLVWCLANTAMVPRTVLLVALTLKQHLSQTWPFLSTAAASSVTATVLSGSNPCLTCSVFHRHEETHELSFPYSSHSQLSR